jgi:cytochrome P450
MLAAEGSTHKRQRRVATPAFSIQNMRASVPLVFTKGNVLKDKWLSLIEESDAQDITLDVAHWVSRATFDVIGTAGRQFVLSPDSGC